MTTEEEFPVRWNSSNAVVAEMMQIYRSLPPRPHNDDVEAAMAIVRNVDSDVIAKLERIPKQIKGVDVPSELFYCLTEMQTILIRFTAEEQKREALQLIHLENTHSNLGEFFQRASSCFSSAPSSSSQTPLPDYTPPPPPPSSKPLVSMDDTYLVKAKPVLQSSVPPPDSNDKLSLVKLASLIESSARSNTEELSLPEKLQPQIQWLPDSIGKLSSLKTLDLERNTLISLPPTIGNLSSLTTLNLKSNQLSQLPDSLGDLHNLKILDLASNSLQSLPSSFSNLTNLETLDLSANKLPSFPQPIVSLVNLKKLIVSWNSIEELPPLHCLSLVELNIECNNIKALPEGIGMLRSLQILKARYNNIKHLPTTASFLTKLKELDLSFNELESIPESLCHVTSLLKINVGNNFADFQFLPTSIGNLHNLQELDISNNQIRVIPDSFRLLSNLRVFISEGNPLQFPPVSVAQNGIQAIFEYLEEARAPKPVKIKRKLSCLSLCFSKPRRDINEDERY